MQGLRSLLVCRAEGNGDSLLVQHVLPLAVRGEGTGAARRIKEAWVDLAVAGQAGENPSPLLEGVCKDLHDLDAWHVPARLHSLRNLHPINPVQQATLAVPVPQNKVRHSFHCFSPHHLCIASFSHLHNHAGSCPGRGTTTLHSLANLRPTHHA